LNDNDLNIFAIILSLDFAFSSSKGHSADFGQFFCQICQW